MKLLGLFVIVFGLGVISGSAEACSCKKWNVENALDRKLNVAIATPVRVVPVEDDNPFTFQVKYTFKIHEKLQGFETPSDNHVYVDVVTSSMESLCGSSFDIGEKYLLWARGKFENFSTGICLRSGLEVQSQKDIESIKAIVGSNSGANQGSGPKVACQIKAKVREKAPPINGQTHILHEFELSGEGDFSLYKVADNMEAYCKINYDDLRCVFVETIGDQRRAFADSWRPVDQAHLTDLRTDLDWTDLYPDKSGYFQIQCKNLP